MASTTSNSRDLPHRFSGAVITSLEALEDEILNGTGDQTGGLDRMTGMLATSGIQVQEASRRRSTGPQDGCGRCRWSHQRR